MLSRTTKEIIQRLKKTFLSLDICFQKLYLEFDNDKFKNKDPIFGINKLCLDNLSNNIQEKAINVFPIHVIKLHQKQIVDNFIKNNDKKSLITIFTRDFINIT